MALETKRRYCSLAMRAAWEVLPNICCLWSMWERHRLTEFQPRNQPRTLIFPQTRDATKTVDSPIFPYPCSSSKGIFRALMGVSGSRGRSTRPGRVNDNEDNGDTLCVVDDEGTTFQARPVPVTLMDLFLPRGIS